MILGSPKTPRFSHSLLHLGCKCARLDATESMVTSILLGGLLLNHNALSEVATLSALASSLDSRPRHPNMKHITQTIITIPHTETRHSPHYSGPSGLEAERVGPTKSCQRAPPLVFQASDCKDLAGELRQEPGASHSPIGLSRNPTIDYQDPDRCRFLLPGPNIGVIDSLHK